MNGKVVVASSRKTTAFLIRAFTAFVECKQALRLYVNVLTVMKALNVTSRKTIVPPNPVLNTLSTVNPLFENTIAIAKKDTPV